VIDSMCNVDAWKAKTRFIRGQLTLIKYMVSGTLRPEAHYPLVWVTLKYIFVGGDL